MWLFRCRWGGVFWFRRTAAGCSIATPCQIAKPRTLYPLIDFIPSFPFPVPPPPHSSLILPSYSLLEAVSPTRALLDHRQARFTQRLFASPPGWLRPGGGPNEREGCPHHAPRSSCHPTLGGDRRGAGVGRSSTLPRPNHRRGEGRSPPERKRMEAPRHSLDRRLTFGLGGGSSVRVVGPERLDRQALRPPGLQ